MATELSVQGKGEGEEEELWEQLVPEQKIDGRNPDEVSCLSIDLGERALGIVQLLFNKYTHKRTVIAAQLIDVTQKESRKVEFVVKKAMQLFHAAYDKVDINAMVDFVLIEEQPDFNKQMYPLAYALREYFETRKRLSPTPSSFPPEQAVRFIHASLKLDICFRAGADRLVRPIDEWSTSHDYNKALSNEAGKLICRPEERALIERYKRTHDLYDCVLQAQKFLELVFNHTKITRDHDSIRGLLHGLDFSSLPDVLPVRAASSSSSLVKSKRNKRKTEEEKDGQTRQKKQRKGYERKRLVPAVDIPIMSEQQLSLALLPTRVSMPKEQRQLLKKKRDKEKAKLAVGTLLP